MRFCTSFQAKNIQNHVIKTVSKLGETTFFAVEKVAFFKKIKITTYTKSTNKPYK